MNYTYPTQNQALLCMAITFASLGLAGLVYGLDLPGVPRQTPEFPREAIAAVLVAVSLIPFSFAAKLKFGLLRQSIGLQDGHLVQTDSLSPNCSFSFPVCEIRRLVVEESHEANDTLRVETDEISRELMFMPASIRGELIGELMRHNPGIELQQD